VDVVVVVFRTLYFVLFNVKRYLYTGKIFLIGVAGDQDIFDWCGGRMKENEVTKIMANVLMKFIFSNSSVFDLKQVPKQSRNV
jgi:hypothetical protein